VVIEAVEGVLEDYARRGVAAFADWHAQRSRLRAKLAGLIGAPAESIGLTSNTTAGVIDIALCLNWRRGDRIVLFEGEFPANVTPWQQAARRHGLEIVFLPLGPYLSQPARALENLEDTLRAGARLVAVSAVQFQTGLRMPLDEIGAACQRHGAELFVDAIQACGAVPIDVRTASIDYLSCGGHKWLMGVEGTGLLYVAPDRIEALQPEVAGWLSHEDPVGFLLRGPGHLRYDRPVRKRTDFIEGGAYNALGLAALEAAVELITGLGVEAIFAHVQAYLDRLESGLVERGFRSQRSALDAGRSCILSVDPPGHDDAPRWVDALAARGISCSSPDGLLRFAPHWPNADDEVALVLEAIDAGLLSE
jgi:selenocysteine lyase/cysteine desulfurase